MGRQDVYSNTPARVPCVYHPDRTRPRFSSVLIRPYVQRPAARSLCSTIVRVLLSISDNVCANGRLDVEHAAAPVGTLNQGALNFPKLEYQGFEPSPYDEAEERENVEELLDPVSTNC